MTSLFGIFNGEKTKQKKTRTKRVCVFARQMQCCRESEELTLSFLHRDIVLFIHSILVYCVCIDVIISVPRQRDKALPRFCIGLFG